MAEAMAEAMAGQQAMVEAMERPSPSPEPRKPPSDECNPVVKKERKVRVPKQLNGEAEVLKRKRETQSKCEGRCVQLICTYEGTITSPEVLLKAGYANPAEGKDYYCAVCPQCGQKYTTLFDGLYTR